MSVGILVLAATGAGSIDPPEWIEWYDIDAFDGRGDCVLTLDPAKAVRFPDFAAAMEAWKSSPASRPLRADGQPNRPLSAFTVEIAPLT